MELLLKRRYKGTAYTIGSLYVNGIYECDTLEDPDRGLTDSMSVEQIKNKKIDSNTAIPSGTYEVTLDKVSSKYSNYSKYSWAKLIGAKVPRLLNVKGYEGILIHPGNTEKDTAGCILVGENKIKGKVINSTATFQELYYVLLKAKVAGERITIQIV